MKSSFLSAFFIFIIFTGCSTTYKITKYYSKERMYKDFNESVLNRNLTIKLHKGNLLKSQGAQIVNDSLLLYPLNENKILLISQIKEVSYKNHPKGLIPGAFSGILAGMVLGAAIELLTTDHPGSSSPTFAEAALLGAVSGFIVGSAIGYNIGFTIKYQFQK